ncbi:MAG: LysM peptidoglycan-binding domain-containing protein [Planctomycetaceae bacterium]|nr:LysM peptidoglycan-binding domain-containing protein [Planctomycetaceae bacterium]
MKDFGFETDPNSPDSGNSSLLKSENLGNPSSHLQNGSANPSSELPSFLQNPTSSISADTSNSPTTIVSSESATGNFPDVSIFPPNQPFTTNTVDSAASTNVSQQQEKPLSVFPNMFQTNPNNTPDETINAQPNPSENLLTQERQVTNQNPPPFSYDLHPSFQNNRDLPNTQFDRNNSTTNYKNPESMANTNPQNLPGISTTALDSANSAFANPSAIPPMFSTDASSITTTAQPSELTPTLVLPSPTTVSPEHQPPNLQPQNPNQPSVTSDTNSANSVTEISANKLQDTPSVVEPTTQQSPYTFEVLAQRPNEINTTPSHQNDPVLITPINPAGNKNMMPCIQETNVYQPRMATHETVRPLPPVETNASTAPVQPPTFTPQLAVVSLPPVQENPINLTAITSPPHPEDSTVNTAGADEKITPLQQSVTAAQLPLSAQTVSTISASANAVVPLPITDSGEIAPEIVTKVEQIGQLLRQNDIDNAYSQLSSMYFTEEMSSEERQYVAKHLDQLAGGLIFSRRSNLLEPPYTVKESDTVETIATQYRITPQLLRKLNGIPENTNAAAGTQLKVIRGPLDARIYPEQHEMVVILRGKYACRFPLTIGSNYAGQTGEFIVQDKVVNPVFELASGLGNIPPGDPSNPLGSRWIQLSKESGTLGIHGTNLPENIGTTRKSAGVFGLREKDVAEVYDMLVVGSSVKIVR